MLIEGQSRLNDFSAAVSSVRSIPLLTNKLVAEVTMDSSKDLAAVRRSLLSRYEKTPPHELGLPSDEAITGKVGGLARKLLHVPSATMRDQGSANNQIKIQLLAPFTRPIRPANAKGETSFHMSFESITKNHTQFGLKTKSGRNAQPGEHGRYLEDQEKRAHVIAKSPIDAEGFAHYQEREMAMAVCDANCIFTNIKGGKEDRVDLFRAAEESEPSNRPPVMAIDVSSSSSLVQAFIERAWSDEILADAMTKSVWAELDAARSGAPQKGAANLGEIKIEGNDAVAAFELMHELGWREHFQNPKDFKSDGVNWDPGKSGRVQMRVVGEIPHELDPAGRGRFMREIADKFDSIGVPYVLVMHRPTAENNDKNWHFHLIYWDRPADRFSPDQVQKWIETGGADGRIYSKRYIERFQAALQDPAVLAQTGRWDFEVEYTYVDEKGRNRLIHPFKQNKNRTCTRKNFVPDLREFLAELSNRELAKTGANRRVRAEKYIEFDVPKEPGVHLYDAANREELRGGVTPQGEANEMKQWTYLMRVLDQKLEDEKTGLNDQWREISKELRDEGLEKNESEQLRDEWFDLKLIEVKLRDKARHAAQMSARLFSRPNALSEESSNHLEAILNGTASPKVRAKREFHLERLKVLDDHCAGLKHLFKNELGLKRELESQADEVRERAHKLVADAIFGPGQICFSTAKDPQEASQNASLAPKPPMVTSVMPASNPVEGYGRTNKYLDILATMPVPFSIVEERLDAGLPSLVAEISALDREKYGLPARIVAITGLEMKRLVEIHSARINQGARASAQGDGSSVPPPAAIRGVADESAKNPPAGMKTINGMVERPVAVRALQPSKTEASAGEKGKDQPRQEGTASQQTHRLTGNPAPRDQLANAANTGTFASFAAAIDGRKGPSRDASPSSNPAPGKQFPVSARVSPVIQSGSLPTEAGKTQQEPIANPPRSKPNTAPTDIPDTRHRLEDRPVMATGEVSQTNANDKGTTTVGTSQTTKIDIVADKIIALAERREVLVLPHPNGFFVVRGKMDLPTDIAESLAKPENQSKLERICDEKSNEIGVLSREVASNPGVLRKSASGWEAHANAEPGIRMLFENWQSNADVQTAITQIARLPRLSKTDAIETSRRENLFIALIARADWAVEQVNEDARSSHVQIDPVITGTALAASTREVTTIEEIATHSSSADEGRPPRSSEAPRHQAAGLGPAPNTNVSSPLCEEAPQRGLENTREQATLADKEDARRNLELQRAQAHQKGIGF